MKWLLPLGFCLTPAAFLAALPHVPPAYAVDRAQPLVVVTYWQHFGATLAALLLLGLGISGLGYWAVLREPPAPHAGTKQIALFSALCCVIALSAPVIFSSDVYAYAGYGAMIVHGISPYAHARIAFRDPLLDAVQWQWGNPPPVCVYGPAFLLIAWAAALFEPLAAAAPLWLLRIAACVALVSCARLAYAAAWRQNPRERMRAASIVALNPLAIWACAEGHNDVFAIAMLLAGGAMMRSRAFAGAAVAAFAGAVKAPALAGAVALASWNAADHRKRVALLSGTIAGGALCALVSVPLIVGVLHSLAPRGHYTPHFSLAFFFGLFASGGAAMTITLLLAASIAAVGRGKAGYVAFALWMCVPNPYPWYGVWLLPVAAVCETRAEQTALILAAMLGALRYFGEASSALPPFTESSIVLIAYGVPAAMLLLASAGSARAHSRRPASDTAALDPEPHHPR